MCTRWNNEMRDALQSFIYRVFGLGSFPTEARVKATSLANARVLGSATQYQTADDVLTLTAFFNYVDKNKDGYISPDEINEAMAVDYDNSGTIDEWEKVKAGRQWMDTFFAGQNANYDRRISLDELLKWNAQHQ